MANAGEQWRATETAKRPQACECRALRAEWQWFSRDLPRRLSERRLRNRWTSGPSAWEAVRFSQFVARAPAPQSADHRAGGLPRLRLGMTMGGPSDRPMAR